MPFQLMWERPVLAPVTSISVGETFGLPETKVLLGSQGKVKIFSEFGQEEAELETKGGLVHCLLLHDVTKFGAKDVVIGDADGSVFVFSQGEILSRVALPHAVRALAVDSHCGTAVLAGDAAGTLLAFQAPADVRWRLRLGDDPGLSEPRDAKGGQPSLPSDPAVRCVLSTEQLDKYGVPTALVMVCDGGPAVHMFAGNARIYTLRMPCRVNALCAGRFLHTARSSRASPQVAAAGDDGLVYVIQDFAVAGKFTVGSVVTQLAVLPRGGHGGKEAAAVDSLLCAGYFNGVKLFTGGKLVAEQRTADWVHAVALDCSRPDSAPRLYVAQRTMISAFEVRSE